MKHLVVYEIASVLFLIISVYLVHGVVLMSDIEIITMYAMFSGGMLLYVRPSYHNKKTNLKRRNADK
jgi:hypothetical protein